jgi:hypothetical protein
MDWLWSTDYGVARFLLQRGLAALYAIAFLNAFLEFPALLGDHGLEPTARFLAVMPWRRAPSLFQWRYSDGLLRVVAIVGIAISVGLLVGILESAPLPVTMTAWLALWLLYLSIVNVGQDFYAFGWESLLLEAGFLATFLGNDEVGPPVLVILLFRWLAFRLEFGAGLIKWRGDRCWRDLTCMDYHHETQPMPNPFSWFFHHLPRPVHRAEVLGNYFAQLVAPWGLFLPQPIASVAALVMILTQGYLVISGNYAWLNWATIVIVTAGLGDGLLHAVVPALVGPPATTVAAAPPWFAAAVLGVTVLVVVLSWWPARNLVSRRQVMNAGFNPFHLVNTYGAFGSMTRRRLEVVVEGTADGTVGPATDWREYEFRGKPTSLRRLPGQFAPYHLRLDWLMWFAALSPGYADGWFVPFLLRLLENDGPTARLLRHNPFPTAAPAFVRAQLYRYRFSSWQRLRRDGVWWERDLIGEYASPVGLRAAGGSGRAEPAGNPAGAAAGSRVRPTP